MALRLSKNAVGKTQGGVLGFRRLAHALAQPAPLETAIVHPFNTTLPPFSLPENHEDSKIGIEFPNLPFSGGAMELMAVPKKKTSKHKRGIRNGPRALKPVPVIIRCTVCGRVKLPHFFCCSGIKQDPSQHNG